MPSQVLPSQLFTWLARGSSGSTGSMQDIWMRWHFDGTGFSASELLRVRQVLSGNSLGWFMGHGGSLEGDSVTGMGNDQCEEGYDGGALGCAIPYLSRFNGSTCSSRCCHFCNQAFAFLEYVQDSSTVPNYGHGMAQYYFQEMESNDNVKDTKGH